MWNPTWTCWSWASCGRGTLRCAGVEHALEPGALRLLPHGAERAVAAGAEGVVYLTVHRRRPGLAVRPRP